MLDVNVPGRIMVAATILAAMLAAILALQGCGHKGPLMLPAPQAQKSGAQTSGVQTSGVQASGFRQRTQNKQTRLPPGKTRHPTRQGAMNDYFHYQNGALMAEQVPLADIAAQFGTPCYVYSRAALTDNLRQFTRRCRGASI